MSTNGLGKRFGVRLRNARHSAGLTQTELATAAGIDPKCISEMERGLQLPRFNTLCELCLVLHQPGDYLLVRRGR